MNIMKFLVVFTAFFVFSTVTHAQHYLTGSPIFEKTTEQLEKAYCEISNSLNYMYNYLDREDGGLFVYRAHEFSQKAKDAILRAEREGTHFFHEHQGTFDIAKEKIVAAHTEISELRLYDPNRGSIKNRLINPAKAAIRELNHDMELGMNLDTCDDRYPDN